MAVETTRWAILYCPKTGIFNSCKRWEKIQKVLDERNVLYDFVQSETADSVERLVKMMIQNGYKTIVIVGGDSALNDAVNCLMMEEKAVRDEIALGVIPNGVLNDFAKFWDFDDDKIEQTIDWLIKRRVRKIDLGCIRYINKKGETVYKWEKPASEMPEKRLSPEERRMQFILSTEYGPLFRDMMRKDNRPLQ